MRQCLALDLRDDPESIARYEAHHERIWPEIAAHLRGQGVTSMEIWRIGNRLTMVMETDDARFDAARMAATSLADPKVVEWETLMSTFQQPTPWTPTGVKWAPMARIFDLDEQ
ncbi:L-rhamnose mutarotase [Burkholderia gladioli]|uniref:L-rhamnose mutarotase n=1 Tax=Burkholderia gladioli TaxID=28095 RepID=UPI000F0BBD59|nr:L-rhamnose mutarotase [Burkholderia gladioli]AYQ88338.1 L-rhamnose mutarotase [Burkholderia gladioli]